MDPEEREREISAIRWIMRVRSTHYWRELTELRRDLRRLRREAVSEQAEEAAGEVTVDQETDATAA